MKRIRMGIIGQGRSGRNIHAKGLNDPKMREMFEIAAVAELIPERCKETVEENPNCKVYTDYREMLKDKSLDLIVNCTFNPDHAPISMECLEAGFNVVSEKPFAYTVAEADKVIACQKKTGKFFAVFQEARLIPGFVRMMEVIRSGVLGKVLQVRFTGNCFGRRWDWQTLQSMEAGNLSNNGPHPLDQALEVWGHQDPDQIVSVLDNANNFGDADDFVKVMLVKKGLPVIDLEVTSCAAYSPDPYQVYATRGSLTGGPAELKWKYFLPNEAPYQELVREPMKDRKYCSEDLQFREESWKDAEPRPNWWLARRYYEKLYVSLTEGKPFYCTTDQVRRQIAIIEACHKQNPLPKIDK